MLRIRLIFSLFLTLVSYSVFGFFQPVNYYPDNKLHSINYANGVIAALSYDQKGQLHELQHSIDGENLYQVSYEYDSHGNRTKRFDEWGNEHRMQMFMYNAEDWLLKHSTLNDQHIYYYTPTGNRESYKLVQGDNNDVIVHEQYHYNQRDQLVQIEDLLNPDNHIDFTYDENGNQLTKTQNGVVTENKYDGRNRIHSHQVNNLTTTYHYDHLGRRIQSESNNEFIRFHYNLNDQLVVETNQLNDVIRTYNHGNQFQLSGKSGDNIFYYHNDDLNSPNVITAPDKSLVGTYQYLPFGDKTILQGLEDNPIGFTGYYLDNESDQYYAQQRYYNQYAGMFNREDPVEGDFNSPLSLNRYVYANNNPLIYIDPTGEVGIVAQDELKVIDELSRSSGTLNDPSPGLNALINEYGLNDYIGSRHIWQGKTGREQQFVSNKGIQQLAKLLEDANNGYAKASAMMVIENGDSPEAAFKYVNDYVGHVSDDTKQALLQYTSGVQRGDLLDVSFAYNEGMYRANDRVWLNKVSSGLKGVRSQLPWLLQNYTSVHQAGIDIVAGTESMIRHNSLNTLSERAPKPMRDTANAELVISGILGSASRFVKLPVSGVKLKPMGKISDDDFVRFDPKEFNSSISELGVQSRFFVDEKIWLTKYKDIKHIKNARDLETILYRKNLWNLVEGKFNQGATLRAVRNVKSPIPSGITNKTNGVRQWHIKKDISSNDLDIISTLD